MTTLHILQTVLEIVLVGLCIIGFIFEPALADWEEAQKEKVIKAFKERKRYWK